MRNDIRYAVATTFAVLGLALAAPQSAESAGKIVCWKDASGKTVGCGDTVPPEYRGAATKELSSQGVTRKTTESAEDAAKRREQERASARDKAEEDKRIAEQRRQDATLIATFSSPQEIDAKAEREQQTLDLQIRQQRNILQTVNGRYNDLRARKEKLEKGKQPVPQAMEEDLARIAGEKEEIEQSIASKESEKAKIRRQYGEMKARYTELRGGSPGAAAKK